MKPSDDELASHMITDREGVQWIPVGLAARMIPTPHGKKTHTDTIHAWIRAGRLESRYRLSAKRRWWYVRLDQVQAMASGDVLQVPEPEKREEKPRTKAEQRAWDEFVKSQTKGDK